jgi:uncharacterized protein
MAIVKEIILITNEFCNLDCRGYCYEHHKTDHKMSISTAAEILDRELKYIAKEESVEIEFIGGESFLVFDLIKEIVEYIDRNYSDLQIYFTCTTNGTLIHGEIQKWLYDNRHRFYAALSLDGTKEMHDMNRPFRGSNKGSFDSIDLDFFINTWDVVSAKMTVSPITLPYFSKGVKFIHEKGFKCDATFATGISWESEDNINILAKQLEELIEFYRENPQYEVCRMLSIDLGSIFTKSQISFRYCGAGKLIHAYDCKGTQYPCQGFAPITLGEESKKYIGCDFSDFKLPEDSACATCKFVYMCSTCYATNNASTGDIGRQSPEMCIFNRMCILASSKIQYYRIMQKCRGNMTQEDQKVLKAIQVIQEEIFNENNIFLFNFSINKE